MVIFPRKRYRKRKILRFESQRRIIYVTHHARRLINMFDIIIAIRLNDSVGTRTLKC